MALREDRLDRIAAGKTRLWQVNLRLSQCVNCLILLVTVPFISWQRWTFWASGVAAAIAVSAVWAFARWMSPREQRLARHMAALARRRRTCAHCGYCIRDLQHAQCPECGERFDPTDTRHELRAETVRMYSSRGRLISAAIVVGVLFWVSALAQGRGWIDHLAFAGALLAAFFGLHVFWKHQARAAEHKTEESGPGAASRLDSQGSVALPPLPTCGDCGETLCDVDTRPPAACPGCQRPLTRGDVFVRPDVRRLSDPRVTSLQLRSLILRWVFLVSVCGGLVVMIAAGPALGRRAAASLGAQMLLPAFGLGVAVWVTVLALVFRGSARRLQRRMRLLFALITPVCPQCGVDVSETPVGEDCSACSAHLGAA